MFINKETVTDISPSFSKLLIKTLIKFMIHKIKLMAVKIIIGVLQEATGGLKLDRSFCKCFCRKKYRDWARGLSSTLLILLLDDCHKPSTPVME